MTKENELRLVGRGSRRIINNNISRGVLLYYLKVCKLKVVIQKVYGNKCNILVNAIAKIDGNYYYEDDVMGRFLNAEDMMKFLDGYYACFRNYRKLIMGD